MIFLKTSKRIALTLSIGTFVGLTSVLSANGMSPSTDDEAHNRKVSPIINTKKSGSVKQIQLRPLQSGVASYYGPGFHGRLTANGEIYNQNAMTAAHRTLPFGTRLKVTNLNNGQTTFVRVNDRGPYVGGRIIDLSVAAAKQIGSTHSGVARVKLEVVKQ